MSDSGIIYSVDRLYTCFVSSTFLDLRTERERLSSVLLRHQCVPLGMEFFPSMGRRQWELIEESVLAADFCIFMVGGRYGTISEDPTLSWTHREFRLARDLGKPIAGLLHGDPDSLPQALTESSSCRRGRLRDFRVELEHHTQCSYWISEADLVDVAATSIAALKAADKLGGWIRAATNPQVVTAADFDRTFSLIELDYTLRFRMHVPIPWTPTT